MIAPLGWGAPNVFYSTVASFAGIASALSIAFLAHLRHQVLPSIPAADFLILGLLLGPILEESVFRGCLLPVVARTFGSAFSVLATAALFAAFHGPTDVIHGIWFSATGCGLWMAAPGFSDDNGSRVDACHMQSDFVSCRQILIGQ